MDITELGLFKDISREEAEKIMACSKAIRKKFKEGEYLFRQHHKPVYMYVILSGSAVITKDYDSSRQDVLLHVGNGDVLGEMFFKPGLEEYWYDAQATSDVEALLLPFGFFYGFCQNACARHQTITKNMLEIFSNRNYDLTRKVHILSCNILRERIALWLFNEEKEGTVRIKMNREQLASYLGTTRPSLSRELMRMKEDGLIDVSKDIISITDREGLEECTAGG